MFKYSFILKCTTWKYFALFMNELIGRIPWINLQTQSNQKTLWDVCLLKLRKLNLKTGFCTVNNNENFVLWPSIGIVLQNQASITTQGMALPKPSLFFTSIACLCWQSILLRLICTQIYAYHQTQSPIH